MTANHMDYDLLHSSDSPIRQNDILKEYKVRFYEGATTVASFKFEHARFPLDEDIEYLYRSWYLTYDYEIDEL